MPRIAASLLCFLNLRHFILREGQLFFARRDRPFRLSLSQLAGHLLELLQRRQLVHILQAEPDQELPGRLVQDRPAPPTCLRPAVVISLRAHQRPEHAAGIDPANLADLGRA